MRKPSKAASVEICNRHSKSPDLSFPHAHTRVQLVTSHTAAFACDGQFGRTSRVDIGVTAAADTADRGDERPAAETQRDRGHPARFHDRIDPRVDVRQRPFDGGQFRRCRRGAQRADGHLPVQRPSDTVHRAHLPDDVRLCAARPSSGPPSSTRSRTAVRQPSWVDRLRRRR